ncbi:MAG TPA: hypothetical protein VE987_00505 [Polyangiaceae bacterium]|nr:hypothetical protein [Polyangiaceae bacterium]
MRARELLGAIGGAAVGVGVALVCAGSTEQQAEAGSSGGGRDAGAGSQLVAQAQRGQVAAPGLDEVEPMCALLTSCDRLPIPPALFPPDFPSCVKRMSDEMASPAAVKFSLTMRECGLKAESCAALRACALRGASPDACRGRGRQAVVGFCDVDGRALTCWHDEVLAVRDCTRGDEQCVVADGEATCALGACPDAGADAQRPRCSGSGRHLLRCERGKLESLDCAAFGLKCATDGDGEAGCATSGPPCAGGVKRCDGDMAVGCLNGHEVRVDCAAAGLTCAPSARAQAVGLCAAPPPAAGACDSSEPGRCDGDVIRYCHAGRPRSYSCAALGFHKCSAGKSGVRCGN